MGVEAVAECMADHVVRHHPMMPRVGKTAESIHSTSRLEDSLHTAIMTVTLFPCKQCPYGSVSVNAFHEKAHLLTT